MLPSVSSHSLSSHKARQQLLFLNSPFSVMDSLVGLVGETPLRTCVLYRSFTWVSAPISLVLAKSRDTIRFSYNTPIMALFRPRAGSHTTTLSLPNDYPDAFYQTAVRTMLPRQMERLCLFLCTGQAQPPRRPVGLGLFSPSFCLAA